MSNSVLPSSTKYQKTQQNVVPPHTGNTVTVTSINNGSSHATSNKRVKVTLACAVCRKKKVKCDGIQPTCSRCNSMGFSCQYSDPPKKRGPPKGQVEIIESRAHRIESLRVGSVSQNNHKTASVTNGASGHDYLDYSLINKQNTTTSSNRLFSSGNNTILHLISGAVDALQTDKWSTPSSPLNHQDTPGSHNIQNDFFMKDDLMINNYQRWISCYFGYFNVFFPVLSQPHFTRQISQQQADPLLIYAVCAIGSKYSDQGQEASHLLFERCQYILRIPRDTTTLSTVQALVILCWYAYLLGNMQLCCDFRQRLNLATNELQLNRDPGSSFGIVAIEMRRRAFWVIFVTDQWLSCCTGVRYLVRQDSWNCQWPQLEDSQLLVIDSKQWKPTSSYNCLNDEETHQSNHQHTNDSSLDYSCHMPDLSTEFALQITAFSEMIKLSCIVYDIYDLRASSSSTISQQQQSTVDRLTDWLLRLPPYLEYGKPTDNSPPSPIARIYHMLYYTVQIMIHHSFGQQSNAMSSSAIYSPLSSEFGPASPTSPSSSLSLSNASGILDINMSRSICTNAANTIIHIAEQMMQYKQQTYLHNTFMTSLTLAASVHWNNTLHSDQNHGISALLNLDKSFHIITNCNCSALQSMELGKLLDRYVFDHCGIRLYDKSREQQLQARTRRTCSSLKRTTNPIDHSVEPEDDNLKPPRKRRTQQRHTTVIQQPLITTYLNEPQSPLTVSRSTSLEGWGNNNDDLLDTRLQSLLYDIQPYSSTLSTTTTTTKTTTTAAAALSTAPSPSSSPPSNRCESEQSVLDPTWFTETNSFLDLFSNASAMTMNTTYSPSSQYHPPYWSPTPPCLTTTQHVHSPMTLHSPTQSPTLSSDSTLQAVVTPVARMSYYMGNESDMDYFKLPSDGPFCPLRPIIWASTI
ncbi:fungal-specific transcription factor domain-domain-containing protein [Absidia repens]|uniref:Fungal-specific transcription factor domain-domain-containing protein n=1 Tax=Absidia repens TaxID=90262 RepID=A0A1X2ID95_9FUNG|nr:fungal-specific transcription factor domain-domain-containing protein [Absidia repens]